MVQAGSSFFCLHFSDFLWTLDEARSLLRSSLQKSPCKKYTCFITTFYSEHVLLQLTFSVAINAMQSTRSPDTEPDCWKHLSLT